MRVASPFIEWAGTSLNLYRIIEPETWSKVVGRVNGANFGAIYLAMLLVPTKGTKIECGISRPEFDIAYRSIGYRDMVDDAAPEFSAFVPRECAIDGFKV